jgi:hypothetical protein
LTEDIEFICRHIEEREVLLQNDEKIIKFIPRKKSKSRRIVVADETQKSCATAGISWLKKTKGKK